MNLWKILYLNYGERCDDKNDRHSYDINLALLC